MPPYNQSSNFILMYPVKGEEGAMAYPVAPGQKVTLIDTENAIIYVNSTNQFGQMMPLEVYDLVFRQPPVPEVAAPSVSGEDLDMRVNTAVKEALQKYFPQINFND